MADISYRKVSNFIPLALIWQFPQTLIALLVLPFVKKRLNWWKNPKTGMTVFRVNTKYQACWSLGAFVFVREESDEDIIKHETGHSMQSLYLGPLYLLVIAVPSIILFWIRRFKNKSAMWYHLHFPENWADSLGGVSFTEPSKDTTTTVVNYPHA